MSKKRKRTVVEMTAGIFKNNGPVLSAEELREAAAQAIADDVMERMNPHPETCDAN